MTEAKKKVDQDTFRKVLGHYPTGVCVVTGCKDGVLAGMAIGSFTSVSLDPPLVAFFPDRKSTSWPKIREAGRFCVNVLACDQEGLCRQFASKAEDKFVDINYTMSDGGSPILDDVVVWIDCMLYEVYEAGDHYIALGEVMDMRTGRSGEPLLFLRGSYGNFRSLAATDSG